MFRHLIAKIRRAYAEFLTIPTIVIGGFLLLALSSYFLDQTASGGLLNGIFFSDTESVGKLLGVIASSVITLTSITFALLLVAVQQGAAALTSQVYDQFLRRKANQFYFGFFIGLALYALVILATNTPSHTPIYGVAIAFFMTVVTLYLLILLIYTTIDQMRPVRIIHAIRDYTLAARQRQMHLLESTRRSSRCGPVAARLSAESSGFLVSVDIDAIAGAAKKFECAVEIVVLFSIGDYVTINDAVATISTSLDEDARTLKRTILEALVLEEQRDLATDPAFGIEQLVTIGWTSGSTAKSNPEPALLVCQSLRHILASWFRPGDPSLDRTMRRPIKPPAPVVYCDNVPRQAVEALQSLMVVASESMQHQTLAEILQTFALLFQYFPENLRDRAEDILMRSLSALGDHVLTRELDEALVAVVAALIEAGRLAGAQAVDKARLTLAESIGVLNSRSTRVAN